MPPGRGFRDRSEHRNDGNDLGQHDAQDHEPQVRDDVEKCLLHDDLLDERGDRTPEEAELPKGWMANDDYAATEGESAGSAGSGSATTCPSTLANFTFRRRP